MRSLLAVVLSFALFVSNSLAQSDKQKPPVGPDWIADFVAAQQDEPVIPTALYECDGDQCESPTSGGAVWLFEGQQGQGMWLYQAVTKLTVVSFDGHSIRIHRADPVGSYSSQFAQGTEFIADYIGTITDNHIEGQVYWGGGPGHGPWHATIVNRDFCTQRAGKCPLHPDQLSILGRRASEAKMYASAFRCFELAAAQNDADGEGFEAEMMMNGWGGKHSPAEIMSLLKDSAGHDSYAGEKGLARAYEDGVVIPRDARQAAYWNERAVTWQQRKEAQESAQMQGRVMSSMLIFSLLVAAMSGDSGGQDSQDGVSRWEHTRAMGEGQRACNLSPSNCH